MEIFLATLFEDVRQERSLMLFLSLTDPDTLKKIKITDHEYNKESRSGEIIKRENNKRKCCCILIRIVFLSKE